MKVRKMAKVGTSKLRTFNKSIHEKDQETTVLLSEECKEYTNIKNNKQYLCLGEVINATNSSDGQIMVLYTDNNNIYVREKEEFHIKFK